MFRGQVGRKLADNSGLRTRERERESDNLSRDIRSPCRMISGSVLSADMRSPCQLISGVLVN